MVTADESDSPGTGEARKEVLEQLASELTPQVKVDLGHKAGKALEEVDFEYLRTTASSKDANDDED